MEFMDILKSASRHYGPERRVIFCNLVGSSKSTIVTALKKGLEQYTQTDEGALYSFSWKVSDKDGNEVISSMSNERRTFKTFTRRCCVMKLII